MEEKTYYVKIYASSIEAKYIEFNCKNGEIVSSSHPDVAQVTT